MNREEIIKEILGETVEQLGFYYEGCLRGRDVTDYTFVRKRESEFDISQSIWVLIFDNYKGGYDIRLTFDGRKRVEAYRLIESQFREGDVGDSLHFENEKELEKILHLFRKIIEKKGKKVFDDNRRTQEEIQNIQKKREMHRKLYQNRKTLNANYRKLYGLENTQFTAKLIRTICGLILEKKDEKLEDMEDFFIGMAAVYGDQLIRRRGGDWIWEEDTQTCLVKGEGEYPYHVIPLWQIEFYWERKEDNYLRLLDDFKKYPTETVI